MFKGIKIRATVALIVFLAGLFYLLPSLTDRLPSLWENHLPKDKIRLGLDLQGGMHLVLEVEAEKAVETTLERTSNDLKETLMKEKVRFRRMERSGAQTITIDLPDSAAKSGFEKILQDQYPDMEVASSQILDGKEAVIIRIKEKRVREIMKLAVEQSVETIRNRVDQFGIAEPEIIPEGEDRIIIQLPGIKDTERAKNLIGKTALLEFKLVDEEHILEDALKGNVPEGSILAQGYGNTDRETGRRGNTVYLLKNKTLLTGESLESAQVKISDRFGEPYVALEFNAHGANDFERITGENVKKRLAIVLDGLVHSAPVIQEKISGGQAQITGSFTMEEAKDLSIVLRAGSLPAPVHIIEERTVGPSLGLDSIRKGIWSTVIGGLIVAVFMIIYYKFSGIIANVALIANLVILLGVLAAFHATLTLPGIAGIVLTIGMAVDANVLIYERIREELRGGKTPRAAIDAGYDKAFLTILDSNVTTLISALFLFQFGTGPVKGFAVTLSIGLVVSMFTAIFVTRIIYDYFIWYRRIERVSV
ncbi:MAG: protein translocase subunit SecD [Deltaproteobacteria bacterium]|nr:protein translocase subunit SecD [Deltaproteobacteria bacterium]